MHQMRSFPRGGGCKKLVECESFGAFLEFNAGDLARSALRCGEIAHVLGIRCLRTIYTLSPPLEAHDRGAQLSGDLSERSSDLTLSFGKFSLSAETPS